MGWLSKKERGGGFEDGKMERYNDGNIKIEITVGQVFMEKKGTNQASQNNLLCPPLTSMLTLLHMCHLLPVLQMSSQF